MVGQMIGRYRVLRPLGEGGMARVYAAEDTNVGRQVAIKVLLPEFSSSPGIVERFMNEAKAMGRIRHPGVVDVFEVMVAPSGELCIIMELVVGETLREALWKRGPLPAPTALSVMEQLADTVAAAHAERIIHRDLKPENVFLVPDPLDPQRPRVRVLDFGIAKVEDGSVKTATGTQMGTATYMAPEQFRNAKLVDHRAMSTRWAACSSSCAPASRRSAGATCSSRCRRTSRSRRRSSGCRPRCRRSSAR